MQRFKKALWNDGSENKFMPGDVSLLPSYHDVWVVGDKPVIVFDVTGMEDYARKD